MPTPNIPTTVGFPSGSSDQAKPWWQQLGSGLGDLGTVLGKQAQGDASAAAAQGNLDLGMNADLLNLYRSQQDAQNQAADLDLARQQFGTTNRAQVAKQALIGALLGGGYQPTQIGPGFSSGGLVRSLNSNPDALAALRTLGTQASTAQQTPLSFTGGQLITPPTLKTPTPVNQKSKKGFWGSIFQDIGAVAPLAGLL